MTEIIAAAAFWVFAVAALAGAFGTVMARRLFHNALSLVIALSSVAALYVLLSADFLAAVQMPAFAAGGQRVAAGAVSLLLFRIVVGVIFRTPWPLAARPLDQPTTAQVGMAMLTTYVFPFELASVLLLAAMIGAILLARED